MKFKVLLGGVIAVSWIAMLCDVSNMIKGTVSPIFVGESGIRIFQVCCLICLLSVSWPMAKWEEAHRRALQKE